jgi:hypothetical protein
MRTHGEIFNEDVDAEALELAGELKAMHMQPPEYLRAPK